MIPNILIEVHPDFLKALGIKKDAYTESARILVITGDNASGKSFLRRIFHHFFKAIHKLETIHLSQEARATGGIERAFVYGDEGDHSTGYITAGTFVTGFRTSRGREGEHVLIWDEPEIGLGEEAQIGAGEFFVKELSDWPKNLRGLIVMTHSRHIVSALMGVDGSQFINVGGKYATADEWLNRKLVPIPPSVVKDKGLEKWRQLSDAFAKVKAKK